MAEGFRAVVQLIQRPGQQRKQVPDDSRHHQRAAQRGEDPCRRAFQRNELLPNHHRHGDGQPEVAEDEGDQHRRSVGVKHPIGDIRCGLNLTAALINEFEDQCHIHEHGVDVNPGCRPCNLSDAEQLHPLPVFLFRDVDQQQIVHAVKTHVVQERSDKAAEDAGHHAPGPHLQISHAHHEANTLRRLPFACRGKQEVADHIEQASDDANDQKPF